MAPWPHVSPTSFFFTPSWRFLLTTEGSPTASSIIFSRRFVRSVSDPNIRREDKSPHELGRGSGTSGRNSNRAGAQFFLQRRPNFPEGRR